MDDDALTKVAEILRSHECNCETCKGTRLARARRLVEVLAANGLAIRALTSTAKG